MFNIIATTIAGVLLLATTQILPLIMKEEREEKVNG